MTVLIFANGDIEDVSWIRPYLRQASVKIAADGGVRHLLALAQTPDLVVGDMDSITPSMRAQLEEAEFVTYSPAKDETDLELALLYAVSNYTEDIKLVFGAAGGRTDQSLSNIFLLAHPALQGQHVQLVDQFQRVRLITPADGAVTIRGKTGDTISLIPCGSDVTIRQTHGLRWPLRQEVLAFGPARGISNEMTAATATVQIENGRLICVHISKEWQR